MTRSAHGIGDRGGGAVRCRRSRSQRLGRLDQRRRRGGDHAGDPSRANAGLGLITEPMLRDLQLDRVTYANINLWATLLGAVVCLPIGRLFDRAGLRGATFALTRCSAWWCGP